MIVLIIDLLALGAVVSSIFVITAHNPVISVLFLIAVFLNVAGYLVLYGVPYVGLIYIIVYVGAIAILFLFVIMMLNLRLVELTETGRNYTKNLPLTAILGTSFFFLFILQPVYSSKKIVFNSLEIQIAENPFRKLFTNLRQSLNEIFIRFSFSTHLNGDIERVIPTSYLSTLPKLVNRDIDE
jgi:NADH:ubiquinone oxidoreductase subunit 6 (subunit J)